MTQERVIAYNTGKYHVIFRDDGTPFGIGKPRGKFATEDDAEQFAAMMGWQLVRYTNEQMKSYLDQEFKLLAMGRI